MNVTEQTPGFFTFSQGEQALMKTITHNPLIEEAKWQWASFVTPPLCCGDDQVKEYPSSLPVGQQSCRCSVADVPSYANTVTRRSWQWKALIQNIPWQHSALEKAYLESIFVFQLVTQYFGTWEQSDTSWETERTPTGPILFCQYKAILSALSIFFMQTGKAYIWDHRQSSQYCTNGGTAYMGNQHIPGIVCTARNLRGRFHNVFFLK